MSEGRTALVALIRECNEQIKACGPRAAMYDIRQEDGRCFPIGTHGQNFGSQQWHLGFAAGIQWVQMRLEGRVMASRHQGAALQGPPTLPQPLLNLIGEYGMARTDQLGPLEVQHRWLQLIDGIKSYASDYAAAKGKAHA